MRWKRVVSRHSRAHYRVASRLMWEVAGHQVGRYADSKRVERKKVRRDRMRAFRGRNASHLLFEVSVLPGNDCVVTWLS